MAVKTGNAQGRPSISFQAYGRMKMPGKGGSRGIRFRRYMVELVAVALMVSLKKLNTQSFGQSGRMAIMVSGY